MKHEDMSTWEAGFINSNRGHYILAQALFIAMNELNKVEGVMKEVSNIADMQYLLDNYFDMYQQILKLDIPAVNIQEKVN
tara:strand:- start:51 stop:290 length:240 start_codon:yes stop_codon:yes gene_type:complete